MRMWRGQQGRFRLNAWRVGGALVVIGVAVGIGLRAFGSVPGPAASVETRQDPASLLECSGFAYSVGQVLYSPELAAAWASASPVSPASPDQIATRWAIELPAGRVLADRRVVFESEDRTDVTFADPHGHTVAVLAMVKEPQMGWRIESIYECP